MLRVEGGTTGMMILVTPMVVARIFILILILTLTLTLALTLI